MVKNYAGKPQVIKTVNQDLILNTLRENSGITQPQISERTGISLATVNKTIKVLLSEKKVICLGDGESTGGRPAKRYEINPEMGLIVCVYVHSTGCTVMLANLLGDPIRFWNITCGKNESYTAMFAHFIEDILHNFGERKIEGIGIAVPGTVRDNVIYNIPAVPEWEGINLESTVREAGFEGRITIENDMRAAAMGVCGNYICDSNENIVFLSVSDNIGACLIINGHIFSSKRSFSGEIAYMALDGGMGMENGLGSVERLVQKALEKEEKGELLKIISGLIVNICCVIDPDRIIIVSPYIDENDVERLPELIGVYMEKAFIPDISFEENNIRQYLIGLVSLCLEEINRPMRIVW